jgi:hypothetical protein
VLRVCYVGGTIKRSEQMSLKKMIFRGTRGKAFCQFFDVEIEQDDRMVGVNDHQEKLVYIVFFEEGLYTKDRVFRICQSVSSDPV